MTAGEWWYVEDRHGNRGYVPHTYLKTYPQHATTTTATAATSNPEAATSNPEAATSNAAASNVEEAAAADDEKADDKKE